MKIEDMQVSDLKIKNIEYKLLLNGNTTEEKMRDIVNKVLNQKDNEDEKDIKLVKDKFKKRRVVYLDTTGFALRKKSFIIRARTEYKNDTELENNSSLAIKFRSSLDASTSKQRSLEHIKICAVDYGDDAVVEEYEVEEDCVRAGNVFVTKTGLKQERKDQPLGALSDSKFKNIGTLGEFCKKNNIILINKNVTDEFEHEVLLAVNNITVAEEKITYDDIILMGNDDEEIKIDVDSTAWKLEGDSQAEDPVVREFSYKYKYKRGNIVVAKARCEQLLNELFIEFEKAGLLYDAGTKTSIVYNQSHHSDEEIEANMSACKP